jgi:hypothetical protein
VKEKVHEQIDNELKQASRTDTIITIISIVITFILFGASYAFATMVADYRYLPPLYTEEIWNISAWAVAAFFISLIALVVVDLFTIFSLKNNIKRKARLVESLARNYQEEGAPAIPVEDLSSGYKARGNLFIVILSTLAAFGFIIPLIVFIDQIIK